MSVATSNGAKVRALGLVTIILGLIFVVAGIATWAGVSTKLVAERITVSDDAPILAGATVADPLTAFIQADVINGHALKATGGRTYAEIPSDELNDKGQPVRNTAMNASFLRASLFTSVIAFGVALFAMGVGVLAVLTGWALRLVGSSAPQLSAAASKVEAAAV